MGRLGAELCGAFELRSPPALLELDLDLLISRGPAGKRVQELPRFPEVRRDVALVLDEAVSWAQLTAAVEESSCDLRQGLELLSVYRGQQAGAGRKSLAFSVTYRSPERTLTDDEVSEVHGKLVEHLLARLGARLRA
jgi:phenylalanyl-tRNA synthetase beta chain